MDFVVAEQILNINWHQSKKPDGIGIGRDIVPRFSYPLYSVYNNYEKWFHKYWWKLLFVKKNF